MTVLRIASWFERKTDDPWKLVGFALAVILLLFSTALLLPGNTFDRSRTYDTMRALANENQWGFMLVFIGVMSLLSLFLRTGLFRAFTSLLVSAAFGTIGACIWHAGGLGAAGAGTYVTLSMLSLACGTRLAFDRAAAK